MSTRDGELARLAPLAEHCEDLSDDVAFEAADDFSELLSFTLLTTVTSNDLESEDKQLRLHLDITLTHCFPAQHCGDLSPPSDSHNVRNGDERIQM
jgi:hypothetical protein